MPAPARPGGIAAQVVLASTTGMGRDDTVNTFHFDTGGSAAIIQPQFDYVSTQLASFYNTSHHASTNPLCSWLSAWIDRSANKAMIKLYDMGAAHPRQPHIYFFTLGAASPSDTGLPPEVALCGSYKAATLVGPSGRGRIYLGPLHANAVTQDQPHVHPATNLINGLAYSINFLYSLPGTGADASRWSVYSRKLNELHPVTAGWVDNEFDTQRRRGHRATVRTAA